MPMTEEEIQALVDQIAIYKEQLDMYELAGAVVEQERVKLLILEAEKDLAAARPQPTVLAVESVKQNEVKEIKDFIFVSEGVIKFLEQDPIGNKLELEQEKAKLTDLYKKLGDLGDKEDSVSESINRLKQENSAKAARIMASGYLSSRDILESYKATLKNPRPKGGVFKSNQVEKGNIADRIISKLDTTDPSDLKQMQRLKADIEEAIQDNFKATGMRLWNRGGSLNTVLDNTLDMVNANIKTLEKLSDPVSGVKKEQTKKR